MADIALNMQTDSSKPARACNWCGTDISHRGVKALFCENKCKKRHYRSQNPHTQVVSCTICKTEIDASGKAHKKHICSKECWLAWDRLKHARMSKVPISLIGPLVPKECIICNGLMISFNGRDGYCSTNCKAKAWRTSNTGIAYMRSFVETGYYLEWQRNRSGDRALASILTPMTGA